MNAVIEEGTPTDEEYKLVVRLLVGASLMVQPHPQSAQIPVACLIN